MTIFYWCDYWKSISLFIPLSQGLDLHRDVTLLQVHWMILILFLGCNDGCGVIRTLGFDLFASASQGSCCQVDDCGRYAFSLTDSLIKLICSWILVPENERDRLITFMILLDLFCEHNGAWSIELFNWWRINQIPPNPRVVLHRV